MKAKWKAAEEKARAEAEAREKAEAKIAGTEAEYAAEQERRKVEQEALAKANERILKAEIRAAAGKLADPSDALRYLNLADFEVGPDGEVDQAAITASIEALIKSKPYLAAQGGGCSRPSSSPPRQVVREARRGLSPTRSQQPRRRATGQRRGRSRRPFWTPSTDTPPHLKGASHGRNCWHGDHLQPPQLRGRAVRSFARGHPLLSSIGGLTGGESVGSVLFEWQGYDLRDAEDDRQRLEGADAPDGEERVRYNASNVLEVHQEAVNISYTKQGANRQRGAGATAITVGTTVVPADELAWQLQQQFKQIARDVEKTFITGTYARPAGNTAPARPAV
ncbi:hypothetical protein GCM10025864_39520 [Luteimicrobium album]|uniref:Uncharacterized protein n=1 Tax=Luteimicrobium album TaxID=1054550 RepID=A0ABQ6I7R6_9MICO|nr:hypothetical protein GCM10025864_39520 [Luteimicrobium album]